MTDRKRTALGLLVLAVVVALWIVGSIWQYRIVSEADRRCAADLAQCISP